MGTLLNRRRVMEGNPYDEFGYIKDGKIFLLDGIDKGSNEGYWTDLIGGVKYALQQTTDVGANYVKVPPFIDSDVKFNNTGTYKTAEICFSELTQGGALFYGGYNGSHPLSFAVYRTGSDWVLLRSGGSNSGSGFYFTSDTSVNFTTRNTGTISGNDNLMMFGGNISIDKRNLDFAAFNNDLTRIGGRPNRTTSDGYSQTICKVHALRFYNRLLTQEEMLHN